MQFSEVLEGVTGNAGSFEAQLTPDWAQGRSIFGGIQAAVALRAMRKTLSADAPLRALQTTFLSPVPPGLVHIEARVLRAGKNVVHAEARVIAGGEMACLVVGVFGQARPSVVEIVPKQPPVDNEHEIPVPVASGFAPEFHRHFDVRLLRGGLLFSGAKDPTSVFEMSMRDAGKMTVEHAVAIADVIPPLGLTMLTAPAPGSSVTWLLEMLTANFDAVQGSTFRVDAEVTAAKDGYTNQSSIIWGPAGEPVALSRQNMVVFG